MNTGSPRCAPLVSPPDPAAAVGRGLPGGRGAGRGRVPRAPRPLCVCVYGWVGGGQVGTPRAPVGCPSPPRPRGRCRAPRRETFRPPSGLLFSVWLGRPRGSPLRGDVPCHRRGTPPRRNPEKPKLVRLLAVDHSARASMKNAASCEN